MPMQSSRSFAHPGTGAIRIAAFIIVMAMAIPGIAMAYTIPELDKTRYHT